MAIDWEALRKIKEENEKSKKTKKEETNGKTESERPARRGRKAKES